MRRESFILHCNSLSILEDLNNQQIAELFKAIRDYNNGEEPKLEGVMRVVFAPFKNQFDRDNEKYQAVVERNKNNGKLGGRPKITNSETIVEKPKETQKTQLVSLGFKKNPKNLDNDSDSDNDLYQDKEERVVFAFFSSAWNSSLPDHAKVSALTDKRKKAIKARLPEFGKTKEDQKEVFQAIIEKIKTSTFLCGDNERGWRPDFDWLFKNSDNWRKVYEGKFDSKSSKTATVPTGGVTAVIPDGTRVVLGAGEYIHARGHRTIGSGVNEIPLDAPPRPSSQHYWDRTNHVWQFNAMM